MASKACSDTGPLLHLHEIQQLALCRIFSTIFITSQIKEELDKYKVTKLPKSLELKKINKDQVALLAAKYDLQLGESSVIWLCKALHVPIVLTDDLDARDVSEQLGLTPVGTMGIIMRGYREKLLNQEKAIQILKGIHTLSSLFVTSDLIKYAINEIQNFKRK
jgi:predicted nucleic acid-binding protein